MTSRQTHIWLRVTPPLSRSYVLPSSFLTYYGSVMHRRGEFPFQRMAASPKRAEVEVFMPWQNGLCRFKSEGGNGGL